MYRRILPLTKVPVMAMLMAVIAAPVQVRSDDSNRRASKPPGERIVRFPKDRSLGRVGTYDWNAPLWTPQPPKGEKLGQARGDVVVPAGKQLVLMFADERRDDDAPIDLSPLDELRPTDLQALVIPFARFNTKNVERLTRHASLRYLSLGPLSKVTDESLAPLEKMTWLEVLLLPEANVTDKGLVHLKNLTNLKKLTLYGTAVTDRGLVHLKRMTQLKDLRLGFTEVTDVGLEHLYGITNLQYLQLWKTQIRGPGLVHLKQMSKLETLNLTNTKITNADLIHLKPLTNLKRLDLSYTSINDGGLVHLATLSNLKTLLLAKTQVTDLGVNKLKESLTGCEVHR